MEAIGERPGQYGGNVVVLGRAGVTTPAAPSGFDDPATVGSGSFTASGPYEYDDGSRLSPGWRLHAVPAEPTQADAEPAGSVTGHAGADSAPGGPAEAEFQPAGSQQADSAVAAPSEADSAPTGPAEPASALAGFVTGPAPADSSPAGEPLGLAELGRLAAQAAAAAPSILARASYVEAVNYAAGVEEISRTVEYLQVLSAGNVDRTRTQAIAAADTARAARSRTGKTWVTGWDNGVETLNEVKALNGVEVLNETDTNWPGQPAAPLTSPADDGCPNTAESLRLWGYPQIVDS